MTSRREMLGYAVPAIALMATATSPSTAVAQETCAGDAGRITREQFDSYIALYNEADPAFTQFYADDVVMETVPPLVGAQTIANFSRELRTYLVEHITVEHYVSDGSGSAAQFLGEFRCIRDMPVSAFSGLFGKAVKAGQVLRQRGTILYGVEKGKIKFIRAAPPIILQDWS